MSHLLEIPDDLYAALQAVAEACGTTPLGWTAAHLPPAAEPAAAAAQEEIAAPVAPPQQRRKPKPKPAPDDWKKGISIFGGG